MPLFPTAVIGTLPVHPEWDPQSILELQLEDPEAQNRLLAVRTIEPQSIPNWSRSDNLLLYKGSVFVPNTPGLRSRLIRLFHHQENVQELWALCSTI